MKTIPKVRIVRFKESKVLGLYNPQLRLILVSQASFFILLHETIHHISNLVNIQIYDLVSKLIDTYF